MAGDELALQHLVAVVVGLDDSGRDGGETQVVADAAQAAVLVPKLVRGGDTVLVKASRGVGLERVAEALAAAAGAPA